MLARAACSRPHRAYDHRLRNALVQWADPTLFAALRIPDSTARTWLARGPTQVVTLEDATSAGEPLLEVLRLRTRNALLTAIVGLLLALLRARGGRLAKAERLPEGDAKVRLLHAITRARTVMPLGHALRVLGLGPARYHAWRKRELRCVLDDARSCPRSQPTRLSARELFAMRSLALGPELAHMTTRALALFAQRQELVHATAVTKAGPPRRSAGAVPALSSTAWMHARLPSSRRRTVTSVERVLDEAAVLQLVAQGHVTFSNSMIEAFWRSMKHGFLFQQRLDSIASLTRFVDFYVHQHNAVMPHSAFQGQTPDEVFAGMGAHVPGLLAKQRADARAVRIAENRRAHCSACPNGPPPTEPVP